MMIRALILVVGAILLASADETPKSCNNGLGECIPYYLCKDGKINTDGSDLLDISFNEDNECVDYFEQCCGIDDVKTAPIRPAAISYLETVECDYSHQYYWTTGHKNTNVYYYKCNLDTEKANFSRKLTRIDGQHETGRNDGDVKWLANYKDNKLKTFSSIFCQKFPNLRVIQIGDAELESVDEDSLENCKNLEHLWLSGNKFHELLESLLIGNSNLIRFWVPNNQLTTLPENLFWNQRKLENLDLSKNQINFLPVNIFRPLVKLEVLFLYNNKLRSINPECFANLQNLKQLGLNGNQISEVPSKCFASLSNLEKLFLYENKIKTLNPGSFDGLRNLQILGLRTNEISDLPARVFGQLKNLQELSVRNNKLTTIHSDSFGVHNRLTKIYLQDNKITAIDEKFIDNATVSTLNMTNNICSQINTETRIEIKPNLKKCFDNYQLRSQYSNLNAANSCGKSMTGQGNIIGGKQITRGSFPWIAALITPSGQFFCGGTLVSSRKVLTAAHCIQDKHSSKKTLAGEFFVQLGVYDLNKTVEVGRIPFAVETVNVHPDWNIFTESFDADIAVLVLESEVTFNKYIQPICLVITNSNVASLITGVVVGFGKSEDETKFHENIPKILETPIHNNADCFLDHHVLTKLSSKRTFCGGTGNGTGVCRGDSGSGLFVTDGSSYFIRGIVSSSLIGGKYGCDVDVYSVFTDVTKYINWINEISTTRF